MTKDNRFILHQTKFRRFFNLPKYKLFKNKFTFVNLLDLGRLYLLDFLKNIIIFYLGCDSIRYNFLSFNEIKCLLSYCKLIRWYLTSFINYLLTDHSFFNRFSFFDNLKSMTKKRKNNNSYELSIILCLSKN